MTGSQSIVLRLYVAGQAPQSELARARLRAFCDRHEPERYVLEVVDILRSPARALSDGIMLTPTLARVSPLPGRQLVGALSDERKLAALLGVSAA